MSSGSGSPPPASPRPFPPPAPAPAPAPSPPAALFGRLSNGSQTAPSPTESRGSAHGVSFLLQIGLTRETVTLDPAELTLSAVRELVCSIVDQKTVMLSDECQTDSGKVEGRLSRQLSVIVSVVTAVRSEVRGQRSEVRGQGSEVR
ncbi:serine/threonine-protein kinase D3-like, partial [Centroberyx affinis]|uniref:serine/threonine-protein kinase D3-like n=1 Tax=Centroberyx affinis TaxID=166261 RepID=UPI003A5C10BC